MLKNIFVVLILGFISVSASPSDDSAAASASSTEVPSAPVSSPAPASVPTPAPASAGAYEFETIDFRLPADSNLQSISFVREEDGSISYTQKICMIGSDGKSLDDMLFEGASPNMNIGTDFISSVGNISNVGGFTKAGRHLAITLRGEAIFLEGKYEWGNRAVFAAAAGTPSHIRSLELLPREGGAKRAAIWGCLDFSKPGFNIGMMPEKYFADFPEFFGTGFTVCGCDVRIVYAK